ncbi:hypothetical protein Y043_6406 [Burkholderia pseudomallei MSHR2138]|nr:hypothetical protein Y043_6406 [Burkholderia pseudomallei MSHR2138]
MQEIEHVVHDLEGDTEVPAVLAERANLALRRAGQRRADLAREPEQHRGLAVRDLEIMIAQESDRFAAVDAALVDLAAAQRETDVEHEPNERHVRLGVDVAREHADRLDELQIADENRHVDSARADDGRDAAPQRRGVDDVVVDQRRDVQHLERHRAHDRLHGQRRAARAIRAKQARREQQQKRPDLLAALVRLVFEPGQIRALRLERVGERRVKTRLLVGDERPREIDRIRCGLHVARLVRAARGRHAVSSSTSSRSASMNAA